jgi:dolichol-phosphate mannosyltransferase
MPLPAHAALIALVAAQALAAAVLVARLGRGWRRPAVVRPMASAPANDRAISILLATLNEASRIGPCLRGLIQQGPALREVIVIDSHSADGTSDLVAKAAQTDSRVRLVTDPPLPPGWIGKVWALQHGLQNASGEWILGIDADTEPAPGMVDAILDAANRQRFDVVSFAPRFAGLNGPQRWLQPALLTTLIYRFGAPGTGKRVMANGQCFLVRRDVLVRHGGYTAARASFADDVTLARHLASCGARVGFLDGAAIISVRPYRTAREMWREWGRSIDLTDTTTPVRQWLDVLFLVLVQGIPLIALALWPRDDLFEIALPLNVGLVAIRIGLQAALAHSYDRTGLLFWCSWLGDPLACLRIVISSARRPTQWRGRQYSARPANTP